MAADQERFARAAQIVARGFGRISRERARAGDMTPQQAETLQLIAEKGAVSTSSLATLLGIDPWTASRNLAGLERAGLISRKKGAEDARQTDVRLTRAASAPPTPSPPTRSPRWSPSSTACPAPSAQKWWKLSKPSRALSRRPDRSLLERQFLLIHRPGHRVRGGR